LTVSSRAPWPKARPGRCDHPRLIWDGVKDTDYECEACRQKLTVIWQVR